MDWLGGASRAAATTDASRWNEEKTEFPAARMKKRMAAKGAARGAAAAAPAAPAAPVDEARQKATAKGAGGAKLGAAAAPAAPVDEARQKATAKGAGGAKLGDTKKAISASNFMRTLKRGQGAVIRTEERLVQAWGQFYLFVIVLLLLFIVHQVTLTLTTPLSTHPRIRTTL
jgi:hypothetical protein